MVNSFLFKVVPGYVIFFLIYSPPYQSFLNYLLILNISDIDFFKKFFFQCSLYTFNNCSSYFKIDR